MLVVDGIHEEFSWRYVTHCAIWGTNCYGQVFVHVKNENKPFPAFTSFGLPVHLKLVAKLTIQGGGYEGLADWEGQVWQSRKGLRDSELAFKSAKGNEGGYC